MFEYFQKCMAVKNTINVITINGYQLKGTVTGVHGSHKEPYAYVTMSSGNKAKRVFMHAISTVEEV